MEDELWIEKELEHIRQEFNLTDEQFRKFREQRSLESQLIQLVSVLLFGQSEIATAQSQAARPSCLLWRKTETGNGDGNRHSM